MVKLPEEGIIRESENKLGHLICRIFGHLWILDTPPTEKTLSVHFCRRCFAEYYGRIPEDKIDASKITTKIEVLK